MRTKEIHRRIRKADEKKGCHIVAAEKHSDGHDHQTRRSRVLVPPRLVNLASQVIEVAIPEQLGVFFNSPCKQELAARSQTS